MEKLIYDTEGIYMYYDGILRPWVEVNENQTVPNVKGIYFTKDKNTCVKWDDNTITVVSVQDDDVFDKEKGIAMCFMKKALGNTGKFNEVLKKYCKE